MAERTDTVTIGAGVVALFYLARLYRALCEDGNRHFTLLFFMAILLTLAALSPVAMIGFWKIQHALWRLQHG
jgi:hypothetical protein